MDAPLGAGRGEGLGLEWSHGRITWRRVSGYAERASFLISHANTAPEMGPRGQPALHVLRGSESWMRAWGLN